MRQNGKTHPPLSPIFNFLYPLSLLSPSSLILLSPFLSLCYHLFLIHLSFSLISILFFISLPVFSSLYCSFFLSLPFQPFPFFLCSSIPNFHPDHILPPFPLLHHPRLCLSVFSSPLHLLSYPLTMFSIISLHLLSPHIHPFFLSLLLYFYPSHLLSYPLSPIFNSPHTFLFFIVFILPLLFLLFFSPTFDTLTFHH